VPALIEVGWSSASLINLYPQYFALLQNGVELSRCFKRNARKPFVVVRVPHRSDRLESSISPWKAVDKVLNATVALVQQTPTGSGARHDIFAILVDADTKARNASQQVCKAKVAHPLYLFGCQIVSDAVLRPLVEPHVIQRVISLLGRHNHRGERRSHGAAIRRGRRLLAYDERRIDDQAKRGKKWGTESRVPRIAS
jgi:hypothetical protein